MRIAIVGSRSIDDKASVYEAIDELLEGKQQVTLLSGGALGVDQIVKDYAEEKGYDFILFEPYHKLNHRTPFKAEYFFVRNKQIVRNSDLVFAIWDGSSKGTGHTIDYAKKMEVPIIIEMPENITDYDLADNVP